MKAPPSKRSDEAFKRQAVETWLQCRKLGTQIVRDLGVVTYKRECVAPVEEAGGHAIRAH
ncbi:MAG: hypothetical protein ABMA13_22085 [Chthoniobacteraceae bacterium]